ncbi:MAG: hypothetical protein EOO73_06520 [Myxococcales bacterium]|nr:MAG: hypothetical protein EOO73_06520 [Myxococcales bacterium]
MRAIALSAALACAGCATTTLRSGEAPGRTAAGYDERWHPGFLFGTVRGKEPYDLSRLCPNGWAEIRVAADPFTVLAGAVTLFMYSPSRITVVCARQAGDETLAF